MTKRLPLHPRFREDDIKPGFYTADGDWVSLDPGKMSQDELPLLRDKPPPERERWLDPMKWLRRHITSIVYPGETVKQRTTKGKWLKVQPEEFEAFWNGPTYRYLRNVANFKVPREEMDPGFTCSHCIKPHMPYLLFERGFQLPGKLEKRLMKTEPDLPAKRQRWRDEKVSLSSKVVGDR